MIQDEYVCHIINFFSISLLLALGQKNICMFAVTRPSLLKCTDLKHFLARICKKYIEDLYLFTRKSFASSASFNVTEIV